MATSLLTPGSSDGKGFAATRWTVVMTAASSEDSSNAAEALSELCKTYWYPLFAFLRRRGHATHEAEDLTQAFFANLLARDFLSNIDRRKGKFRSFLLASLKNFLSDERERTAAQKRGGGKTVMSLDAHDAETRYQREPAHDLTPEKLYEKQWALSVLEHVLGRLREESIACGKFALHEALQGTLTDDRAESYADIARTLGMTEGAIKTAAHRLRRRYRELLYDDIAQTVAEPVDVEEEIRYLMSCLYLR